MKKELVAKSKELDAAEILLVKLRNRKDVLEPIFARLERTRKKVEEETEYTSTRVRATAHRAPALTPALAPALNRRSLACQVLHGGPQAYKTEKLHKELHYM